MRIKDVVIFTIGLGIGGGIGFVATRKYLEDTLNMVLEETLIEERSYMSQKEREFDEYLKKVADELEFMTNDYTLLNAKLAELGTEEDEEARPKPDMSDAIKYYKRMQGLNNEKTLPDDLPDFKIEPYTDVLSDGTPVPSNYTDYSEMARKYVPEVFQKPSMDEMMANLALEQEGEEEPMNILVNDPPESIFELMDESEFFEWGNLDVVTYVYYAGDGAVSNEGDALVVDPDAVMGPDWLEYIMSEDVVYIVNHKLELGIELVRDERSFTETVLGITQ